MRYIAPVITLTAALIAGSQTPQRELTHNSPRAARLSGIWCMELEVTAPALGRDSLSERYLAGAVSLIPVEAGEQEGPSSHWGLWTGAFQSVGVRPPAVGQMPTAEARSLPADSVVIVLNPAYTHGAMYIHGRLAGDSISGRWEVTGYARGAIGTGRLVRARPFHSRCRAPD